MTADHLDGVRISVRNSSQPFSYLTSVTALSAFGDDVPRALGELKFAQSRTQWDDGFTELMESAAYDDLTLIAIASAMQTHVQSGGTFLRPDQVEQVRAFVQTILTGERRLPPLKGDAQAPDATIVSLSMLDQIAGHLGVPEKQVGALVARSEQRVADATLPCSPSAWAGDKRWILIERATAGLGSGCSEAQLRPAWESVVEELEASDFPDGFGGRDLESLKIAMLMTTATPRAFDATDRARVQSLIDVSAAKPSTDPYVWVYEYKFFADVPDSGYDIASTPASDMVLLETSARGAVPEVMVS